MVVFLIQHCQNTFIMGSFAFPKLVVYITLRRYFLLSPCNSFTPGTKNWNKSINPLKSVEGPQLTTELKRQQVWALVFTPKRILKLKSGEDHRGTEAMTAKTLSLADPRHYSVITRRQMACEHMFSSGLWPRRSHPVIHCFIQNKIKVMANIPGGFLQRHWA